MILAFLSATATMARLVPQRSTKLFTHRLRASVFRALVRTTARAPCTSSVRRCWSPCLVIPPVASRSPLARWRGASPSQAARCRPFLNSRPSPTAATIAVAVFGPTPAISALRRRDGSWRNARAIRWSKSVPEHGCETRD
jgi:hypothetical protein